MRSSNSHFQDTSLS